MRILNACLFIQSTISQLKKHAYIFQNKIKENRYIVQTKTGILATIKDMLHTLLDV